MARVILSHEDLPLIASSWETKNVDFKGSVPNVDGDAAFELAKDVAAFANAAGGSLLHCAHEDKKRRALGRYEPVTQAETAGIVRAYDFAIRDRCFPGISWSDARIALDRGFVVAIKRPTVPWANRWGQGQGRQG